MKIVKTLRLDSVTEIKSKKIASYRNKNHISKTAYKLLFKTEIL